MTWTGFIEPISAFLTHAVYVGGWEYLFAAVPVFVMQPLLVVASTRTGLFKEQLVWMLQYFTATIFPLGTIVLFLGFIQDFLENAEANYENVTSFENILYSALVLTQVLVINGIIYPRVLPKVIRYVDSSWDYLSPGEWLYPAYFYWFGIVKRVHSSDESTQSKE